jgi:hypothetical protein
MSNSPRETNLRFEKAIKEQWNCQTMYVHRADCQQESCGDGAVYVYDILQAPIQWPEAKHCFVWDCKNFKEGAEGVAVVLDKQVIREADQEAGEAIEKYFRRLALGAVLAWKENWFPRKPDVYISTERWSREKLDGHQVEYGFPAMGQFGTFRVRQRSDGHVAVRIFNDLESKISFPIVEVDKVETPPANCDYFSLPIDVGFE